MAVKAIDTARISKTLDELANKSVLTDFDKINAKKLVDSLRVASPVAYYMYLGIYNAVVGKRDLAVDYHRKALGYSKDYPFFANFAISLRRLGDYVGSVEILIEGLPYNLGSISYVETIFDNMMIVADYSKFEEVYEAFSKANPGVDLSSVPSVRQILKLRDEMASAGIPEDEYKHAMSLVNQILIQNGFKKRASMIGTGTFDGVRHVSTRLAINITDSDLLAKINEQIADAIISDECLNAWDQLVFTVASNAEDPQVANEVA